jgi:hypothetical protein
VAPRASLIAAIVASVPELTMRTFSSDGTRRVSVSAISTSSREGAPNDVPTPACRRTASTTAGCEWPRSIGPHDPTWSTYSRPSSSHTRAPSARAMKRGTPPTALNARTGEVTPPGITRRARWKSASLRPASSARPDPPGVDVWPMAPGRSSTRTS